MRRRIAAIAKAIVLGGCGFLACALIPLSGAGAEVFVFVIPAVAFAMLVALGALFWLDRSSRATHS